MASKVKASTHPNAFSLASKLKPQRFQAIVRRAAMSPRYTSRWMYAWVLSLPLHSSMMYSHRGSCHCAKLTYQSIKMCKTVRSCRRSEIPRWLTVFVGDGQALGRQCIVASAAGWPCWRRWQSRALSRLCVHFGGAKLVRERPTRLPLRQYKSVTHIHDPIVASNMQM